MAGTSPAMTVRMGHNQPPTVCRECCGYAGRVQGVADARAEDAATSKRLAWMTRLPKRLFTAMRNGANMGVPATGTNVSSISRPSDRNLMRLLDGRWPAIGWKATAQTRAGPA